MRQKDYMLIAVIAIISGVLSIVISGQVFSTPEDRQQNVEVVQPISAQFERPSKDYFNENSVNPTQLIRIGENPGSQPFNNEQ